MDEYTQATTPSPRASPRGTGIGTRHPTAPTPLPHCVPPTPPCKQRPPSAPYDCSVGGRLHNCHVKCVKHSYDCQRQGCNSPGFATFWLPAQLPLPLPPGPRLRPNGSARVAQCYRHGRPRDNCDTNMHMHPDEKPKLQPTACVDVASARAGHLSHTVSKRSKITTCNNGHLCRCSCVYVFRLSCVLSDKNCLCAAMPKSHHVVLRLLMVSLWNDWKQFAQWQFALFTNISIHGRESAAAPKKQVREWNVFSHAIRTPLLKVE